MAKKNLKKVLFIKNFQGSFNDYEVKVQAGTEMKLPEIIYDWIQKFKVTKDA